MVSLRWEQVHAWRLAQHHLLERAPREQMLDVVSRICGIHAQMMSAAELSLWARVDGIKPDDVQSALWQERALVKSWFMRGTLHLLTAEDFPLYIGAFRTLDHFRKGAWLKYFKLTMEELDSIISGTHQTLNGSGQTREQLATAVAAYVGKPELAEHMRSGWGSLLKPVSFQGYLCFGPSQGQNVTFVQPQAWLGDWQPVESSEALKTLARRYLMAYGPSKSDQFARWFGFQPSDGTRVFKSLGDELEPVDVEGYKAVALAETIPAIAALDAAHTVRLLPHFDVYTVVLSPQSAYDMVADEHRGRIYRPQAWISPVVLVDGRMVGVWGYDKKRSQIIVTIELFAPVSADVKQGIEAEAARLGTFFDSPIELVYA